MRAPLVMWHFVNFIVLSFIINSSSTHVPLALSASISFITVSIYLFSCVFIHVLFQARLLLILLLSFFTITQHVLVIDRGGSKFSMSCQPRRYSL